MTNGVIAFTSGIINVLELSPKDVNAWDFAWNLHHQCRFSGATPIMWDVLSHTGLVYMLAMTDRKGDIDPATQIGLLIHDAPEAYMVDMPKPFKNLPEAAFFVKEEERILSVLLGRLGIEGKVDWDQVKRYDNQAAYIESGKLFPHLDPSFFSPAEYEVDLDKIKLVKALPRDYIGLLKQLAVKLDVPDIYGLFKLSEHMEPYVNPEDHIPVREVADSDVLGQRV